MIIAISLFQNTIFDVYIGVERDYAHESTGFLTWHRQFLLWFEWEVQYMLESMGRDDYYMFRIPYWDWRKEEQTDDNSPFKSNRLGKQYAGRNRKSRTVYATHEYQLASCRDALQKNLAAVKINYGQVVTMLATLCC